MFRGQGRAESSDEEGENGAAFDPPPASSYGFDNDRSDSNDDMDGLGAAPPYIPGAPLSAAARAILGGHDAPKLFSSRQSGTKGPAPLNSGRNLPPVQGSHRTRPPIRPNVAKGPTTSSSAVSAKKALPRAASAQDPSARGYSSAVSNPEDARADVDMGIGAESDGDDDAAEGDSYQEPSRNRQQRVHPTSSSPSAPATSMGGPPAAASSSSSAQTGRRHRTFAQAPARPPTKEEMETAFEHTASVSKLRDENTSLRKSLLAKDEELSTLADAVLSLRDELASVKGQSHVEAHRAIAKKAHDLQRLLGKEKATVAMLLEQKTMLESKLEAASRSQPQSSGGSSSSSSTSSSNNATAGASSEGLAQEVEQLRTRLAAETTRAQRALTDLATTKAEVGRLRSVISREVGEQVSEVDKAGWKGRAEMIARLRTKVADLSSEITRLQQQQQQQQQSDGYRIETTEEDEYASSSSSRGVPSRSGIPSAGAGSGNSNNGNNTTNGAWSAKQGAALLQEMDARTQEIAALKSKLHTAKTRTSALEAQMASLKEKLSVCIAKSDGDDALIDTLKAQIVQLEQQLASPALAKAEQTAAEAVELRKVRTAQEGKIEQQTQTINLLVGEIERLKEIRKVFVKTGLKQWMLDEAKIKADALESALSETTSLLQARDEKIVELEKTVTELTGKATHAVTRAQVLEMRLGNRPKATAGPGVPPPSARLVSVVSSLTGGPLGHGGGVEKGLALAEQLEVVSSEKNVLASAMSEALYRKDQEISRLTSQLETMKTYHTKSLESLTARLKHVENCVAKTGYGPSTILASTNVPAAHATDSSSAPTPAPSQQSSTPSPSTSAPHSMFDQSHAPHTQQVSVPSRLPSKPPSAGGARGSANGSNKHAAEEKASQEMLRAVARPPSASRQRPYQQQHHQQDHHQQQQQAVELKPWATLRDHERKQTPSSSASRPSAASYSALSSPSSHLASSSTPSAASQSPGRSSAMRLASEAALAESTTNIDVGAIVAQLMAQEFD